MSGVVPSIPRFKFWKNGNTPVSNGSVTIYQAGTTTLADTYQDKALTILNANPVNLDADGECTFWTSTANSYRFVVTAGLNGTGATVDDIDNIPGGSHGETRDRVPLSDYSPSANGTTSDTTKVLSALTEASSRSGATVHIAGASAGYGVDRPVVGSQRGLPVPANVSVKGENSKLVLLGNSEFIYLGREQDRNDTTFVSFYGITAGVDYAQVTADTTTTTTALTVNTGDEAAFTAGDLVYVRLGQAAYDSAEPDWFYFAKVVSTASGSVTLDRPAGYALDVDASTTGDTTSGSATVANVAGIANVKPFMSVTGTGIPANTFVGTVSTTSFALVNSGGSAVNATASNVGVSLTIQTVARQRRIIKLTDIPENILIEGLYLQGATSGTPNAEFGIHMRYARNITFRNISGRDVGPGLIGGQFAENILIENVSLDACSARAQASKGRMFSFAECQGVTVVNYRAEKFDHVMAFIEGGCEQVRFIDGIVINNASGRSSTDQIFFLAGAQDLHVDGLRLEGDPCTIMQSSTDTKLIPPFLRNVSTSDSFSPAFGTVTRWFDVDHVDENVKMGNWFTFTKRKRFTLELTLQASKAAIQNFQLPNGVYAKIRATVTSKTGILSLGLSRGTGAAIPVPTAGGLALLNDMTVNVPFDFPKTNAYPWWIFGAGHPFTNPAQDKYVYYTTDGTLVAGTKVYIELEYFPNPTPTILQDTLTYWATT